MEVFRLRNGSCYHLPIKQGELPPYILTCGSPERIIEGSRLLDKKRQLANNRGLVCLAGQYKGISVAMANTGMGPASASIVLPELLNSVQKRTRKVTLIRVGTCGALHPELRVGDLVIATGAVRDEGTTKKWAPTSFPAIADIKTTLCLLAAATGNKMRLNKDLWLGVVHVKDELYGVEIPTNSPLVERRTEAIEVLKRLRVLATEMEFSVYCLLAAMEGRKKIEVGCIDVVVSPAPSKDKPVQVKPLDTQKVLRIALDSLVIKSQLDRGEIDKSLGGILSIL